MKYGLRRFLVTYTLKCLEYLYSPLVSIALETAWPTTEIMPLQYRDPIVLANWIKCSAYCTKDKSSGTSIVAVLCCGYLQITPVPASSRSNTSFVIIPYFFLSYRFTVTFFLVTEIYTYDEMT